MENYIKEIKWTSFGLLLGLVFMVLVILHWANPEALQFKEFADLEILSVVSTMFVIAIFMERSIQAILIPLRARGRIELEKRLNELESVGSPSAEISRKVVDASSRLNRYNVETGRQANWIGFSFGLLISLAGVRVLAGFVESGELGAYQDTLFSFADILLTGGVIAGGSAAIDKIGRQISNSFGLESALDFAKGKPENDSANVTSPPTDI